MAGMTEGGGACILAARKHPDKPYTVGRSALGLDIRLIDDHGVEVAPGQSGEAVVRNHLAVAGVAVVGVPFQRCGETPVAFVLPRAGAQATAGELLQWSQGELGKTQCLSDLRLCHALPRSAIGKILKRELRVAYPAQDPQP
jgi:acyl-coenzyme A synthetase/AMP-(fatty) acid ligase